MDKVNILVVDDRPENLLVLEGVLNDPGYHLVKARSGEEALKHLLDQGFALILLDARMPGMDGFETARVIRSREKTHDIPIIFMTAEYKTPEYISRGYALNAVDYMLKPFDPAILRAKVSVLVELYRKTAQVKRQAEQLQESEKHLEKKVQERTISLQEANKQLQQEIAERNRTEEALKERTGQLEGANKELEAFSYSVSHDLRAPLRAIQGFAQIITRRHRVNLNAEGQHYFDNIIEAGNQMSKLIEDLLMYSRLGRQAVHFKPVSLKDLLTEVVDNLAARVTEADAYFSLPSSDNLPVIHGNRTLLSQIFSNLLDNALNYRRPEIPLRVALTCQIEADHVSIRVTDNGIGIPPEFHEKIFNIFQRLHSQEECPGTGIGLATVKKSVELLGGRIWVESVVGEGSTFYVKLPCVRRSVISDQ